MLSGGGWLYFILVLFLVGAIFFVMFYAGLEVPKLLDNIPGYNQSYTPAGSNTSWISPLNATTSILAFYPRLDTYLPFIMIMIGIGIIASVILLPINTMTLAITFPIMIITIIVSFILSNASHEFFGNPIFANVALQTPNTLSLFANLGKYMVVFLLLYFVVIGARARFGNIGGGRQQEAVIGGV